ncbi:CUE domain-containing protein 2 isoform X2 [Channa argus]|uniref:CUE domain-containing protein 2 isoform X2 n=1 Tax=Channa argus TaxID=215402 RepID=UPI003522DF65
MDLHKIIHNTLHEFIQTYIPDADLSTLDDVLLSYITGVLEDLGSQQSVEENFDAEVFAEMLEAYIPGFAKIDSVKVCEMMFNMASKLATARTSESSVPKARAEELPLKLTILSSEPPQGRETQCLKTQTEGATAKVNHGKNISSQADQKLKESILEKYMLVDREDDKKTHRPVAPKDAPKKLVRYHGNQVVTTKGERYQLVKKNETEDMKKTYVNLKPARKYRFH